MNRRLARSSWLALFATSIFIWIGCTSETSSSPAPAASIPEAGADATVTTGLDAATDAADANADPDEQCRLTIKAQECASCCAFRHQDGYATFFGSLLACGCNGAGADDGGMGPCATECGAACTGTQAPTAACSSCLAPLIQGACSSSVIKACAADPDCLANQHCKEASKCLSKP